jgi:hypothetical protein
MFFVTLVVMTLLCLAFPITRAYGILGAGLLFYLNFYWTLGVVLLAGAAYFYFKHWRKPHGFF